MNKTITKVMDNILAIEKLTNVDLYKRSNVKEILNFGNELIHELNYPKAYKLAKILEKKLSLKSAKQGMVKVNKDYAEMIAKLKTLALNFCTEEEAIEIFDNSIAYALGEIDINILERLKAKLFEVYVKQKDEFRSRLKRALDSNQQILTSQNLMIDNEKKPGTVGNWISDYIKEKGAEQLSQIEKADYFSNNKNLKKVSQDNKKKIQDLISVYEFLKLSSLSLEGLEYDILFRDGDGPTKILSGGRITDLGFSRKGGSRKAIKKKKQVEPPVVKPPVAIPDQESLNSTAEQEVMEAYQGDPQLVKAITKEEKKISKRFGNDLIRLRAEFFATVQKQNVNRTIAILRVLAQTQDLENFLKEDAKLNNFLTAIWEKQYDQELVDEFIKNPGQLKFVRLFLRYVLEQRLAMPENEAARVGLQIGNIFVSLGKKGYNKMAYFDVSDQSFKWFE